jgi:hypothetical protein
MHGDITYGLSRRRKSQIDAQILKLPSYHYQSACVTQADSVWSKIYFWEQVRVGMSLIVHVFWFFSSKIEGLLPNR